MLSVAAPQAILVTPLLLSLSTSDAAVECAVEDQECINPSTIRAGSHESDEYSQGGEENSEEVGDTDYGYDEESSEDEHDDYADDYVHYEERSAHGHDEDHAYHGDDEDNTTPQTIEQMRRSRNCQTYSTEVRPLYTEEDWRRFRRIYTDTGGGTIAVDAPEPAGFVPPMRSGQTTDGKGRGVFATRDLRRGERTYGGKRNFAFFRDGPSYRAFLAALADGEACDVMMWAWTMTSWGGTVDEPLVLLPLDDNSFQNSGSDGEEANTGCPPEYTCGMFDEFALRDIKEGEELLCDYGEFAEHEIWNEFGLD